MSFRIALTEAACALLVGVLACVFSARICCAQIPDASTHKIGVGDILQVTLFDGVIPTNASVQVDNTGSISLALLGAVNVQGKLDFEAANQLTELYKTYYVNPIVTITIQQYGRFSIYIFGPDVTGQLMDVTNGTRILDLIQTLAQISPTGKALLTTGRFRRLHLVRGGFSLTALLAPPTVAAGQQPTSLAPNLLQAAAPEAVARNSGSLAAFANWRAWIDQRKRDPISKVWIIDPLRLTVEGELSTYNLPLQDGDVLYIPSPERFVDIEGVINAGRYELLGDETLGDVIRMAGTPNYEADLMNAVVRRYDDQGRFQRIYFNFYPALDNVEVARSFQLENRDRISFFARENRVFVLGSVNVGGAFPFANDSTALDYIAQAEGETADAHLAWIAIIRQSRDRLDPLKEAEVIQVNFKQIHKGLPNCTDISIQPGDVIYVPPKGFQFELTNVLQAVGTAVTGFTLARKTGTTNTTTVKTTTGEQP